MENGKNVSRIDATGSVGRAKVQPNGTVLAPAYLTRTGVFTYRLPNGAVRRELRLPEEVFSEDSMDTLRMAVLTMDHPTRPVTTDNARTFSIGTVGQDVRREDDKIASTIAVTDSAAISQMKAGKDQVSCGYWCDLDFTSGVTEDGQEYDAIQRNIRYNHAAIVDFGRAGPEIRARLDAEPTLGVMVTDDEIVSDGTVKSDAVSGGSVDGESPVDHNAVETPISVESRTMKFTQKFDGIPFEFEADESAKAALDKALNSLKADADAATDTALNAKAEADRQKARADAAEEKVAELEKARADADAAAPEAIRKAVRERAALERNAQDILGDDFNADADDAEIKAAVIVKVHPAAAEKLDGASADYVQARFDSALETHAERKARKEDAAEANGDVRKAAEKADAAPVDAVAAARAKMIERNATAASLPLSASKASA